MQRQQHTFEIFWIIRTIYKRLSFRWCLLTQTNKIMIKNTKKSSKNSWNSSIGSSHSWVRSYLTFQPLDAWRPHGCSILRQTVVQSVGNHSAHSHNQMFILILVLSQLWLSVQLTQKADYLVHCFGQWHWTLSEYFSLNLFHLNQKIQSFLLIFSLYQVCCQSVHHFNRSFLSVVIQLLYHWMGTNQRTVLFFIILNFSVELGQSFINLCNVGWTVISSTDQNIHSLINEAYSWFMVLKIAQIFSHFNHAKAILQRALTVLFDNQLMKKLNILIGLDLVVEGLVDFSFESEILFHVFFWLDLSFFNDWEGVLILFGLKVALNQK